MELVFFGDSITFGYDPRLGTSGRFDGKTRWTARLSRAVGAKEINFSACGLCVPQGAAIRPYLRELAAHQGAGAVVVMFGTNNILKGESLERTARQLEDFLSALKAPCGQTSLICLAPPRLAAGSWTDAASIRLSGGVGQAEQAVAQACGCAFFDTGQVGVDLLFDGVHPSAAGHAALAQALAPALRPLLPKRPSP